MNSNVTAAWRAHKRGALFANPCFTQIHPTCIPVSGDHQSKLTLMSESRCATTAASGCRRSRATSGRPSRSPRTSATTTSSGKYPSFGNLVPRDVASRNAKAGVRRGPRRRRQRPRRLPRLRRRDQAARRRRRSRSGTATSSRCTSKITDEDPYKVPMRIYPAIHYTMGGLWVDYNLMSNVPGLHVLGEANFSDHGANRLGASALMQGLADGYFVIPYTIGDYLGEHAAAEGHDRSRRVQGGRRQRAGAHQQAAVGQGQPRHPRDPPRARRSHVGRRRHGAHRGRACRQRARARFRSCARSSGRTCRCPATHDNLNQSARVRRPRRRLPRVRRAAGARRAAPRRVVRRPLPRGEPDARRRGAARRRALLVRRGLGVHGRRQRRRSCTRSRSSSRKCTRRSGATSKVRVRVRRVGVSESRTRSMRLTLKVWRQAGPRRAGRLVDYDGRRRLARHVVPRDARRRQRRADQEGRGRRSRSTRDCREGICGTCGLVVNGIAARARSRHDRLPAAHAPVQGRRHDHDRAVARARPSRSSRTSSSTAARSIASSRPAATSSVNVRRRAGRQRASRSRRTIAETAMDSAACIGCGACVAACKNASAHLFIEREDLAPRAAAAGPARARRAASCAMVEQADAEGFGSCSNEGECEAVCPKEIPISNIARMNARVRQGGTPPRTLSSQADGGRGLYPAIARPRPRGR